MKTYNFFKIAMVAIFGLISICFASCDNDDDDQPTNALKLSSTNVVVAPQSSSTVTIGGGTAPYVVSSSNEKVATASVTDKTITITGTAEGKCSVKVTDKNSQTSQIIVSVQTPLTVDKTSAEIAVGKTVDITISNGTQPYTLTVKDKKVATASMRDHKITVKGVKVGKTTITVTDKQKKSATIQITVK